MRPLAWPKFPARALNIAAAIASDGCTRPSRGVMSAAAAFEEENQAVNWRVESSTCVVAPWMRSLYIWEPILEFTFAVPAVLANLYFAQRFNSLTIFHPNLKAFLVCLFARSRAPRASSPTFFSCSQIWRAQASPAYTRLSSACRANIIKSKLADTIRLRSTMRPLFASQSAF